MKTAVCLISIFSILLACLALFTSCAHLKPKTPPVAGDNLQPFQPIPTYTVKRAVEKIVINGDASKKTWQLAERAGRFVSWDGKEIPDLTDVKMAWDDEALYVLYVCRDEDIQATITAHDGPIYQEDCVEVFLDPTATGRCYMELIVNPLNTTFDNFCLCNPRLNPHATIPTWTLANWETAVKVDGVVRPPSDTAKAEKDKSWTAEMKIPFSSIVLSSGPIGKPPADGAVWHAALTRYDRPDSKTFNHMAWSAPYSCGWPHVTERFGHLIFSTNSVGNKAEAR